MRQLRAAGLTNRDIAAHLNRKLMATKRDGVWTASRVRMILLRSNGNPAKQD